MRSIWGNSGRHLIVLGILCSVSVSADDVSPIKSSTAHAQAAKPAQLPHVMRPGLKATMGRHAEHATGLTVSVALGAHDQTERHVNELLAEPRPAVPNPDDPGSLNQQVPAKWFALDQDFRLALGKLRDAARARKEEQTLAQLAAVIRACRACHRELKPRP